jgi:mono/diheme cytochrome c family protein
MNGRHLFGGVAAALLLAAATGGCERNDMHNQPRHEPMEASTFFDDGQSSRPIIPGTIARDQLVPNNMRISGMAQGPTPETFPFEITKGDLRKGKLRYEIYCGVCHGAAGDADGMIVKRGFVKPPSFHEQRLKDVPVGHFYDVMTNGWGAMYSYADRVTPEDRWRIAAYIRVLQLAQNDAVAAATPPSTPSTPSTPAGQPPVQQDAPPQAKPAPSEGEGQSQPQQQTTPSEPQQQPGATQ